MSSVPEGRPIIRGESVYAGNDRARRSYAKAGFTLEGTLRSSHFARGERIDAHVVSLLREEWAALTHRRSWEYD